MKNLFKLITVLIALFLFSTPAFADGIASETAERMTHPETGKAILKVTLNCTIGATDVTIGPAIDGHVLKGRKLTHVETVPGTTAPTDASDLTLSTANGLDILDGEGTDLIDSTSILGTVGGVNGVDKPMIIDTVLTFAVTNNVAANSLYTVILILE